ncbi:hypothetical protein SK128_010782 [Halocaridina rubra]|uniref:Aldehyde oxidase/xanthine dehydrogenase a/b hammerhead domain-containing protein n=1 Tax=Halocaridina rubra TaxID=373956 RepID=A0AAN8WAH7_HALRR
MRLHPNIVVHWHRAVVGFLEDVVGPRAISAGYKIERPLSSGQQSFDMHKDTWPVGEPISKLESATQISGEAKYLDDIPYLPNEVHAALVLTTVAKGQLKNVDSSEAKKLPGVLDFVTSGDIIGRNSFVVNAAMFSTTLPDPVFVGEEVLYAGQPVGVIVAKDRDTAVRAAKLVHVQYKGISSPVLTIEHARQANRRTPALDVVTGTQDPILLGDFDGTIDEASQKLGGELSLGTQYHMNMEPHSARVVPTEDGYDVYCTSQWPTETQDVVAQVLDVPPNRINITVRRLGGAFGAKITRQNLLTAAAAVAARKLQQPVRLVADLNTQMSYSGWRESYHASYEAGFDDTGKITSLKVELTTDVGHISNESSVSFAVHALQSVYYIPNLLIVPYIATTDTAANTWCRTPGLLPLLLYGES